MPSILNLKFKGNKSFVPFSNLGDADSLTKTWKVCTKVAGFLEQGQRLENLSWRLWHLQNLIVDTDNAKSKRDFRKLSKCMGDKLDKEKGRSIEELQAPGFRRNHSTELIKQRAAEKERERQANQNGRPGTIHRMQFTFSVDQPSPPTGSSAARKPDLKPSPEFKDNVRRRPGTRSTNVTDGATHDANNKDAPLTQRGRKAANDSLNASSDDYPSVSLHFPSIFSNDFGPAALLYPTPTLTNTMTYGEGVGLNTHASSDGFSIVRPTIELPLDEILDADSPGGWSCGAFNNDNSQSRLANSFNSQEDVDMKTSLQDDSFGDATDHHDQSHLKNSLRNLPLNKVIEDVVPRTITPSRLGPDPSPGAPPQQTNGRRPSLSVRTNSVSTRNSGPSATPVSGVSSVQANNNSAPGGVKAECSNCGATHTPLWRRGLNDELNCNACGLYCKLRPRPKSMRNSHGENRSQAAPRQESQEIVAQCYNCHTTATPLWRKDDEGKTVCNACGLYFKLHGSARPISMKSDVIRKRARHDARRAAGGTVSETPSASPGASRRASPSADTPTLAPDSTTQLSYPESDYSSQVQSELMGALGGNNQNTHMANDGSYNTHYNFNASFPGPYHPDYLSQVYGGHQDAYPFTMGDSSDYDGSEMRSNKRRRMSNDSASEPPSSAVSYSSFSDFSNTSSATSHSQGSSLDFPFNNNFSNYSLMRGNSSALWHPPMLPPDNSPHSFVHPPMLPQNGGEDSAMDFLHHPMQQDDAETLFATYLHPPMLPPDESPKVSMGSLHPHPPMLPNDWTGASHDYYDSSMQTY
ncbi:unnamed protein product [Somion occarium]|uniref:GATA-type domain-containing protein n=1 Tax=Somion occarium TaxID=3059160 RepID=A0ABP1CWH0_9APHY